VFNKSVAVIYSNSLTPQSYSFSMISVASEPTEARAIKVRFLTSPQA